MGVFESSSFIHTLPDINSLKNAIRQEIANVTQDTLRCVMASEPGRWQQCLDCHGGHLQEVVLKTWGFLCESKTLTYLTVFSFIYCCVQKMFYPTFKMGNVKCRTLYIDTITQLVSYYITSCNVKRHGHRQLNTESKSTKNFRRPRLLVWLCGSWQACVYSPIRNTKCVSNCPDNTYTLHA